MKKEDNMVDALLNEHARHGSGDDAGFLTDLEKRLDEDESVSTLISAKDSENRGRGPAIGIGIAAALTAVAVGYYGWKNDRGTDLAVNDSAQSQEQLADAAVLSSKGRGNKNREADAVGGAKAKDSRAGEKTDKLDLSGSTSEPSGEIIDATRAELDKAKSVARPTEPKPLAKTKLRLSAPREVKKDENRFNKPAPAVSPAPVPRMSNVPMVGRLHRGARAGEQASAYGTDASPYYLRLPGDADGSRAGLKRDSGRDRQAPGNRYGQLVDNVFLSPWKAPLSTFSADVDTASYTNMRRMIQGGQAVPKDSVRIEEMVNYFNYTYPQPEGKHPFSVSMETASCPWNAAHRLVKVGLQGKDIIREKRPAANLVFLLDVSGSMNSQDKLPLLVDSMKILLKELNGDDSVSIVVYAGAQGLALPPTYVDDDGRKAILKKLNNFRSGGSTNGGAGITLAYKMAKKNFVKGGVNRVILGTDGDFNVGTTDRASLVSMVEHEAKSGVYLSVLGFGRGNLNDAMLEDITNKGNGNYSYIDSLREGRKVFLDDMMGNMVTIAKDVKIQVEFNPSKVKSYRLIGYANRMLKAEDFKNKRVDAGEIGAGHTVTALYEIVPGNAAEEEPVVDDLKYQKRKVDQPKPASREAVDSPELLTVKLAYKGPEATKETESTYFDTAVTDTGKHWSDASDDFKFSSGVALFGMLQRSSEHAGQGSYKLVRDLAEKGRGGDAKGLRTEFSDLVRKVAK